MKKSSFRKMLDRVVGPSLAGLGFSEVRLDGCISYEALYRQQDLWFGASWEQREGYLDLALGQLHWIKDFMPHVIVLGHYASFCPAIEQLDGSAPDYLQRLAETVAATLPEAIAACRAHPERAAGLRARLSPYLQGRVSDAELAAYAA